MTCVINDPRARREVREGQGRRVSEEVAFEGLSCVRLLTPEMNDLAPASEDSSERRDSCESV